MTISTVGGLNQILSKGGTNDWVGKADLSIKNSDFSPLSGVDGEKSTPSFSALLANSIGEVNKMQQEANTAIQKLASGKSKNIHETMLAVEQAEIAFKTMNQVRRKVLDAYKQIMNMQM
jgi:flagellar hook-basal body complex protein FliE